MNNFNPSTIAYISFLKTSGRTFEECDYSKVLDTCLPKFFSLNAGWFITPEFTLPEDHSPDYLIGKVITTPGARYGYSDHHVVVEVKDHAAK